MKMLSCGRVIGRLSKVTRQTYAEHFNRTIGYVGLIDIGNIRCISDTNEKKPKPSGTTIKPEECIPQSNSRRNRPACEQADYNCPPSCYKTYEAAHIQQDCQDSGKPGSPLSKYWKHLLAALILTGATIYVMSFTDWFSSEKSPKLTEKSKEDKKKKKKGTKVRVPATSSLLPTEVPYLLIGGGTAAFAAFRSIKSRDPKAKVLVITEEEDYPYMRPPLSKELWYNTDRATEEQVNFKQWNGTQRSLFYEPPEFYANVVDLVKLEKGGVSVATGWKVKKLDVVNKIATLEDDYEIKYDKCLLATGALPKNLTIFEDADEKVKEKILLFRTKRDFLELEENIYDPNCKDILIIGGGFLGSELACSLARNLSNKKKKVYQIYKEKYIMAQVLPEYLSEWATSKARVEGVHCISNAEVEDYLFRNGRLSLTLSDGRTIDADQVIVAVGAEANTELAKASNLEVNPEVGGFLVNAELQARNDLWVAGDAACFYDVKLGRRRVEHHDHAVISGRVAGENMTGAGKPYLHQSMFWSDLGPEVGYEAIGIIDSSLPTVGVFAKDANVNKSLPNDISNETENPESEQEVTAVSNKAEEDDKCKDEKMKEPPRKEDYSKGVVFYLRDDVVVGIVLWNIFNRMSIARQVLSRGTKYEDLTEIAKLFTIHEE